jgi:hypothetical protein
VSVHGDNPAIIQVGATYTDLGASNKIPVGNQMTPGLQPGKSYPDTTELAGFMKVRAAGKNSECCCNGSNESVNIWQRFQMPAHGRNGPPGATAPGKLVREPNI